MFIEKRDLEYWYNKVDRFIYYPVIKTVYNF